MFNLLSDNDANVHGFSKTEPSDLFGRLASLARLHQAFRKVRANRGAAGIDAVSINRFEHNLEANLAELSRNLLDRTYEPLPARYVLVPKTNGKERELAIPAVRDRVAQRAVLDAIESAFERQFLDCSFAFRPGRSTEMAVQRIVVARAQGAMWTVEGDVADFFPSIDHSLLMTEIKRTVNDADILRLLKVWLDAGVLDGSRPSLGWLDRWSEGLANVQLTARHTVNGMLDEYLSDRLGAESEAGYGELDDGYDDAPIANGANGATEKKGSGFARTAMKRLVRDGLLYAVAQRTVLRGLASPKVLGVGGLVIGAAMAAPPLIRKLREMSAREAGALQGAPISPLFSNIHLHPFDVAVTRQGIRLIRYCDDFIALCRTEAEARAALAAIEAALRARRLQLHPEKTRILPPTEGFTFLGYEFAPDGRVIAPPTIPGVVRQRVAEFAAREWSRAKRQASVAGRRTESLLGAVREQLQRRLKK